jgi:hypothetical protein
VRSAGRTGRGCLGENCKGWYVEFLEVEVAVAVAEGGRGCQGAEGFKCIGRNQCDGLVEMMQAIYAYTPFSY